MHNAKMGTENAFLLFRVRIIRATDDEESSIETLLEGAKTGAVRRACQHKIDKNKNKNRGSSMMHS